MLHSADYALPMSLIKPCGIPLTRIQMTGVFDLQTVSSALMIIVLFTAPMMSTASSDRLLGCEIELIIPHLGFQMQLIDGILA